MLRRIVVILTLLSALLVAACGPVAAPSPQAPAPAARAAPAPVPAAAPAVPARAAWQADWEKALEAAKKEGRVAIYTYGGAEVRAALVKIARMQGISAEVTTIRAAELLSRNRAERRAGLTLADMYISGIYPMIAQFKPEGFWEKLDSFLILPDLTDPQVIKKVWYQGKLPWCDQDHTALIYALQPRLPIAINTNLVKPDEIKSWRDLLNPKWNGKMVLNDPTVAGSGQNGIHGMVGIMGEGFVRELAEAKPILVRDERLMLDWLAHGKVAVVVAPQLETLIELQKAGAPVKGISPAEGTWLSASGASLSIYAKALHPNASKVFLNSLSTKEGQELFAVAGGYQSTREDVSISHLPPELTRVEGAKYLDATSEQALSLRPMTDKLSKDLFGPLIK